MSFECTPERPWGIHPAVANDEDCRRCGWTAPGPIGDALAEAEEAAVLARAVELGWSLVAGGAVPLGDESEAIAA
jgi:hypothetical protein